MRISDWSSDVCSSDLFKVRPMALRKGGDLIAEFLVREKIPYVFGICGHGNVGLLDSLYHVNDRVKLVSPRHEQTAAHMADGFFRVSHRPAATLTRSEERRVGKEGVSTSRSRGG